MSTLSIDYGQKLLSIRQTENLTQKQFAELTGISLSTIKKYETEQQPAGAIIMERVINQPLFKKYALWLVLGETAEAAGQISPVLTPDSPINPKTS